MARRSRRAPAIEALAALEGLVGVEGVRVLTRRLGLDPAWAALPLRLALGVVFVHSGGGKFRRGISGTGRWMAGLGVPLPQLSARVVAGTELAGGMMLLAGLGTQWAAAPLAFNMAVATWIERNRIGAPFQGSEEAQGYELTIVLGAGALALALLGSGPLSLDRWLEERGR
jgi:putative oxidoreductase